MGEYQIVEKRLPDQRKSVYGPYDIRKKRLGKEFWIDIALQWLIRLIANLLPVGDWSFSELLSGAVSPDGFAELVIPFPAFGTNEEYTTSPRNTASRAIHIPQSTDERIRTIMLSTQGART